MLDQGADMAAARTADRTCELGGKVAIVTGSARNIGRAIALELASAGAALVINARQDQGAAEAVADEITGIGGRAAVCVADITKQADVDRIVDTAVDAFGGIDILVNNAAIRTRVDFAEMTFDDWVKCREVALDGALRMALACTPHMIARGGGCSIIGIGGLMAMLGSKGGAHKSAVKDGMAGLMRGMTVDLGPHGITCNVAVVGDIETDRASGSGETQSVKKPSTPVGRAGQPEEMAYLVRFLAGPYARFISGQTIHVNGGSFRPHSG